MQVPSAQPVAEGWLVLLLLPCWRAPAAAALLAMHAGDAVVIRLSKWPVPSVAAEADPSSDWFSAVRECLHWNLRKLQGGAGA